jgi:hypothetical protein
MKCKRINRRKKFSLIFMLTAILFSSFPQISASLLPSGYHTYDEIALELEEVSCEYNTLTHLVTIGTSVEGRVIYAIKISDNPTLKEDDEPDILYVAEHHSRELITTEIAMGWIRYLLVNYDKDFYVKTLVDTREIWVVPALNPDGYVRVGNGSFEVRKNAHEVDLNRNYGYMWGFDNEGSSDNPNDETYRGPSPFSEPETQAMKGFVESHSFVTSISWHSGMEVIAYPWVYTKKDTPDNDLYRAMGSYMSAISGYPYGNPHDGAVYVANGELDDWLYGIHNVLGFTVEVYGGMSDNMWQFFNPPATQIVPIIEKNIKLAAFIAEVADDPHQAYLTLDFPRVVYTEAKEEVTILGTVTNRSPTIQSLTLSVLAPTNTNGFSQSFELPSFQSKGVIFHVTLSNPGGEYLEISVYSKMNSAMRNKTIIFLKYPDSTPPTILAVRVGEVGATGATITWETDEETRDMLYYGTDNLTQAVEIIPGTLHTVLLQSLQSETRYRFRITSKDFSDNVSESKEYEFTTTDNTPPNIFDMKMELKPTSSLIEWKTDEPSSTQVRYGTDEKVAKTESVGGMTESHRVVLKNLSLHTKYFYRIVSQDSHGNISETRIFQFETPTILPYVVGIISALALLVCVLWGVMRLTSSH